MTGPDPENFVGTERFLVERRLGAGAFGVVYEVFDRERNALVALKTLRRFAPRDVYGFKREFRALSDISHPNLLTLYELLSDGEQWFFTMERIAGTDFLRYVYEEDGAGSLPISDFSSSGGSEPRAFDGAAVSDRVPPAASPRPSANLVRLRAALRQLAEGVCALHGAGQLHRDLKPSNVLVTREGRVVILDFGLVRVLDPEELTQSLEAAGTPAYMSPEQAGRLSLDAASDWYSVGVVLYEALTGRLPFRGPVAEVLRNKRDTEPIPPSEVADGVPADLDALCRELLRRDPGRRPTGLEVLRRLGGAPPRPAGPEPAPPSEVTPLVGRDPQLAALWDAFGAMKHGGTVTVAVQGSSGTGKTALVRRFLGDLRAREKEAVVLAGRCYERESVPYKALDSVVDALSRHLRRLSPVDAEAVLPRDVLALARLFPVLGRVEEFAHARRRVLQIADSQEMRRRAFAALRELLIRMADRWPLVVFIDDLHWSDLDSVALFEELLRPPEPPTLLLIGVYRSEEAESSPALTAILRLWEKAGPAIEKRDIRLDDLAPAEAGEMVRGLLGRGYPAATLAEAIARESAGNPFLIEELVRHNRAGQAGRTGDRGARVATLAEAIEARVAGLSGDARRLLEAVAVAGQPIEPELAARAAGIEAEAQSALAVLRAAHLVRTRHTSVRDQVEVYHDRIRATVLADLSAEDLGRWHHELALALLASGHADPERLAFHYEGAGDAESAGEQAAAAALRASEALAFDRAAHLYHKALALRSRGSPEWRAVAARLGDALANAGRGAEAAEAYLSATGGTSPADFVDLHRRAAQQLLISGHVDDGLRVLNTVLLRLGMSLPETPRRALLSLVARRAWLRLRGLRFRERDETQVPRWELLRIDTCWSAGVGLGLIDMIRGAGFQARHLLLALRAGEPYRVARALALEVGYLSMAGTRKRRRTERLIVVARGLAERVGDPHAVGFTMLTGGIAAWILGRWKEARELCERAEATFRERCTGAVWEILTAQLFSLASLFFLGDLKELSRRLPILLEEARERGNLLAATFLRLGFFSYVVWLAADDPERARHELQQGYEQWSQRRFDFPLIWARGAQRDIVLYTGEGLDVPEPLPARWRPVAQAFDRFTQAAYILGLHSRARLRLALAATRTEDRRRAALLRGAEQHARRIERERTAWGDLLVLLLRAGIAADHGDRRRAGEVLAAAEQGLAAADMALHAAVARRRRGEVVGGEQGRALVEAADSWMAGQGIQNPERMAAMLAPGRWHGA